MALSKIDIENMVTGELTTTNGGTGATSFTAGITEADQWRVTSSFSTDDTNPIASNWERNDTNFAYLGTGMSQSSGVFTFPSTGIYLIRFNTNWEKNGQTGYTFCNIQMTTDNSSYSNLSEGTSSCANLSTQTYVSMTTNAIADITNVTTHKVSFKVSGQASCIFRGDTSRNSTYATFTRLGDT
jgi:hypothetical protein